MDENLLNDIEEVSRASEENAAAINNNDSAAPAQPETPAPFQPAPQQAVPKNPKKNRPLTIVLAIIAVLCVAGVAIFVTLFFLQKPNDPGSNIPIGAEPPLEEEEITEESEIDKIKSKLATVFGGTLEGDLITVTNDNYADIYAYSDSAIDSDVALSSTIDSLSDEFYLLSGDTLSEAEKYFEEAGIEIENSSNILGIGKDIVASTFKDLYGVELNTELSPRYTYSFLPEHEIYFYYRSSATTSLYKRYYHINRYTITNDQVRVYLSGALHQVSTGNVYCDVFFPDEEDGDYNVCTTISEGGSFTFNEDNRNSFTEKTINFIKSQEDEYVFGDIYMIPLE